MADSVKDILREFDTVVFSSYKCGDIDSQGHSTSVQGVPKSNNVDGPSVGCHNAVKPQTPSQSSQKVPVAKDRPAAGNAKDRGERLRQLRERQQMERQQKLQELKEQAAAAQKFREQHELLRRQRLDEMRQKDCDRRAQVEERRRLLETTEFQRKEAALRKNYDRENRLDLKRKQERSNVVFAFGSSTPRMLDPKESYGYWGSRKATSSSNVNVPDASTAIRRPDLAEVTDLSRKRATSAHSLNRKTDGDDIMSRSMTATTPTAARRRTDLFPVLPSARSAAMTKGGKHRSTGLTSGSATPSSSSRPASALSQGSSGNQVVLRSKNTTRKPRPLSIAGSSFSSADKPRSNASAGLLTSRESRPTERKSSVESAPSGKLTRAKSVGGSDSNVTSANKNLSTRTTSTPKRTPAQVKAESAARKAAEKSKATQKRPTPQATPLASPAVTTKPLPSQADKPEEPVVQSVVVPDATVDAVEVVSRPESSTPETIVEPVEQKDPEPPSALEPVLQPDVPNDATEQEPKTDKPVTGYANEEEYKAALAENRRLAREAKEKDLETERQRQLEEAERERKEEEDYLKLMEEQKRAEEERLKKAIEEAERQRELDNKRKDEEEIQRLEAEKIEKQKQAEAAEKMKKEEEERQARKSRVAAIMSRTRGKGSSKGDGKSPDELRVGDSLAMSDSFMANISSSMSDSMIVEAIESRRNDTEEETITDDVVQPLKNSSTAAEPESDTALISEHLNGDSCLETGDANLIGSVNGDVHHGDVTNGKPNTTTDNQFDSFDPFNPVNQTTKNDAQIFDQIIDLNQSKLTNEDVVNSNPPNPIIAFEENMNKKQTQDSTSTNVPDLLL